MVIKWEERLERYDDHGTLHITSHSCVPYGKDCLGSHATYAAIPWKVVFSVPDSVSTRVAAAGLLQGLTTLTFTEEAYKVKKGDVVLVHTVAGGLGLLFTQLIKRVGATVIGTTSTPEKAELAKSYGADHVIIYKSEDTVKRVLEITEGKGVDAIYDGVGKDTSVLGVAMPGRAKTHQDFLGSTPTLR